MPILLKMNFGDPLNSGISMARGNRWRGSSSMGVSADIVSNIDYVIFQTLTAVGH